MAGATDCAEERQEMLKQGKTERENTKLKFVTSGGYLLTDLLQDGGLQLHVFEYGAHYYTLFAHLQVTQLPDGHDTACHTHPLMFTRASGNTQQQHEPVSDSRGVSPHLCAALSLRMSLICMSLVA